MIDQISIQFPDRFQLTLDTSAKGFEKLEHAPGDFLFANNTLYFVAGTNTYSKKPVYIQFYSLTQMNPNSNYTVADADRALLDINYHCFSLPLFTQHICVTAGPLNVALNYLNISNAALTPFGVSYSERWVFQSPSGSMTFTVLGVSRERIWLQLDNHGMGEYSLRGWSELQSQCTQLHDGSSYADVIHTPEQLRHALSMLPHQANDIINKVFATPQLKYQTIHSLEDFYRLMTQFPHRATEFVRNFIEDSNWRLPDIPTHHFIGFFYVLTVLNHPNIDYSIKQSLLQGLCLFATVAPSPLTKLYQSLLPPTTLTDRCLWYLAKDLNIPRAGLVPELETEVVKRSTVKRLTF